MSKEIRKEVLKFLTAKGYENKPGQEYIFSLLAVAELIVQFTQQSRQIYVSDSLPIKVCTGCGWRLDKPLGTETALACCPDKNYVSLDEYLKHSVFKRQ